MFGISSALASQTISKITAWNCLVLEGKMSGELTKFDSDRMTVEGWAVGIRVVLKRSCKNVVEIVKGFSTIISVDKIARRLLAEAEIKSIGLQVSRRGERMFLVGSFQDKVLRHVVIADPTGLRCDCIKFKCLNNRMPKEAPQLLEALSRVEVSGMAIATSQFYDLGRLVSKTHIQCHHIRAVMREEFAAFTSQQYCLNWKQNIVRYRQQMSRAG